METGTKEPRNLPSGSDSPSSQTGSDLRRTSRMPRNGGLVGELPPKLARGPAGRRGLGLGWGHSESEYSHWQGTGASAISTLR